MSMENGKDLYFVAVKVFLINTDNELLIIKDVFDDGWDLPGGRLREIDFNAPLEEVIERKMKEEVGEEVVYALEKQTIFFRHERNEVLQSGGEKRVRIFSIGYQAKYLSGEVYLGEYLKESKWVNLDSFVPEEYFVGGWLKGVKEFQREWKK